MNTKRLATATAVALLLVGGGTVAYAYWSTSGTGSGTAATYNPTATLTLGGSAAAVDDLYPGGPARSVVVTAANADKAPYTVTGATVYLTTDKAGCDNTDYTVTAFDGSTTSTTAALATPFDLKVPAGGVAVPAAGSASLGTLQLAFNNKAAVNQDACKGATVTLHYVAS